MSEKTFTVHNAVTGEDVTFYPGQRVNYINYKIGTVTHNGTVRLDDGTVLEKVLQEQPHKLTPTNIEYDSEAETRKHIALVAAGLMDAATELLRRAKVHDASKLSKPEKMHFDKATPLLASLEFGTDEYKESLRDLGPALDHHYKHNTHHPQHYKDGVLGMDLYDLLEMIIDWEAAGKRTSGGDIQKSLNINVERFGIPAPLAQILQNHIDRHHADMPF